MSRKKREHHEEEHMDETWLIPYSDLLTLLLALFIVLFASSTIDTKKYNAMRESLNEALKGGVGILESDPAVDLITTGQENPQLDQLKQQLDQYIQENNLSKELEVNIINQNLIITIRDYALFDSGSAVIKPESRKTIISISNMLLEYPGFEVLVNGHTDNVPINTSQFESNWDLSAERALNIMKLILQNKGLNPGNFSATGYGEYRPAASNETESGRAKNRRVEMVVKKNK